MPTVLRANGFVVRVYGPPREHAPPHVHVERPPDGLVVIRLATATAPQLVWRVYEMRSRDIVRAFRLVETHHDRILRFWRSLHG